MILTLIILYFCSQSFSFSCRYFFSRVSENQDVNKMSMMNLATVFGPSLLRPPVVKLGHNGPTVDISQEVVVQVGMTSPRKLFMFGFPTV